MGSTRRSPRPLTRPRRTPTGATCGRVSATQPPPTQIAPRSVILRLRSPLVESRLVFPHTSGRSLTVTRIRTGRATPPTCLAVKPKHGTKTTAAPAPLSTSLTSSQPHRFRAVSSNTLSIRAWMISAPNPFGGPTAPADVIVFGDQNLGDWPGATTAPTNVNCTADFNYPTSADPAAVLFTIQSTTTSSNLPPGSVTFSALP